MKLIVTGGAGFIGGNFVHYMLQEHPGDQIICLDKLTYAGNLSTLADVMDHPNFQFVKMDICDRDSVYGLFEKEKPDVVINFAAESHVDRSIENPEIFLQTNSMAFRGITRYLPMKCMAIFLWIVLIFSLQKKRPSIHRVLTAVPSLGLISLSWPTTGHTDFLSQFRAARITMDRIISRKSSFR